MLHAKATYPKVKLGLAIFVFAAANYAAAPSLRDQVDLAGTWTQGGIVPQYRGGTISGSTPKIYERSITIPSAWTGKNIFIEFEAVNFRDSTYINSALIGTSEGGWLPHSYDITSRVTAGQSYTLQVRVQGRDAINMGQWGVGYTGGRFDGILGDVFLRAYGAVAIQDAEVITSVAARTITVKYSVKNSGSTARTVAVNGSVFPSPGGSSVLSIATAVTSFNGGETKVLQASGAWTNPNLWWPDDPKLYHLGSAVKESGTTLDSQTVRFGFRESKISGRNLLLNGVRVNHRGESMYPGPNDLAGMLTWIDNEQAINANSFRFHVKPGPNAFIDLCDELGLMVEDEAPLWQSGATGSSQMRNIWFPAWIKNKRNHASLVHWSAENECRPGDADAITLQQIIQGNDGSKRPIWFEEDQPRNTTMTYNKHYPEGYRANPTASNMYSTSWMSTTVPTGTGETMTCCYSGSTPQPDVFYWHGLYPRALRFNNVALIHVYNFSSWIHAATADPVAKAFVVKSLEPIALFDHDYDGVGIAPIKNNTYPSIAAGSTANRTLVSYNDEFSNSIVTVQVDVKSGSTTYATGTKTYEVVLGEHLSIPCSFQVPFVGGNTMDMVLTSSKSGIVRFTETKKFTVTGGTSGTSSATVTLGGQAVAVGSGRNLHAGTVGAVLLVGRTLRLYDKEITAVRLFDMQGRLVLFCASPAGAVDLSALRPGNYRAVVGPGSRALVVGIVIQE